MKKHHAARGMTSFPRGGGGSIMRIRRQPHTGQRSGYSGRVGYPGISTDSGGWSKERQQDKDSRAVVA